MFLQSGSTPLYHRYDTHRLPLMSSITVSSTQSFPIPSGKYTYGEDMFVDFVKDNTVILMILLVPIGYRLLTLEMLAQESGVTDNIWENGLVIRVVQELNLMQGFDLWVVHYLRLLMLVVRGKHLLMEQKRRVHKLL
ncbi:unnamed protein product [Lactuca saligna]|uniref:Uncharacterized protein n=1 Tax=Lactuca saligna TaxID=75948 RepID=A0AA36A3E8_LACSI|nr:unnamed protein product [Lactuca saligna]